MTRLERLTLASLGLIAALVFAVLYVPVLLVVLRSLFPGAGGAIDWHGFTTIWYVTLVHDGAIAEALRNSLLVGASAVCLSTCLALFLAYFVKTGARRGRVFLEAVILLPFVLPAIITGLSLLLALHEVGLKTGFVAVILGHTILLLPVAHRMIGDRLAGLEQSQIEASQDLGAGHLRTFLQVVLPQLRSAIVAGALLSFTLSFDETLLSFFLVGSDMTVPIRLWSMMRVGFTPEVNAFAALMLVTTLTFTVLGAAALRERVVR